jgi:hypothetical protein
MELSFSLFRVYLIMATAPSVLCHAPRRAGRASQRCAAQHRCSVAELERMEWIEPGQEPWRLH